jgi:GNAT superfamily N-acetyltransferase
MKVKVYTAVEFESIIARCAEILIDAVESGAGVSFVKPLAQADAEQFWRDQLPSIAAHKTFPVVAELDGAVAGLVLLVRAWAPNQPHRCDIAKLLVHRDFRRRSVATTLITALENQARQLNQKLITFDAVADSDAAKLYEKLGFTYVGTYPKFAYSGDGRLDDTALFYKAL